MRCVYRKEKRTRPVPQKETRSYKHYDIIRTNLPGYGKVMKLFRKNFGFAK